MKKTIVLLTLTALLLGILCGCGSDGKDPTTAETQATEATEKTYTVSFVDQEGNPVSNVVIMWALEDGSTQLAISAADGKLYYTASDVPGVILSSVPEGYTAEKADYSFTEGAELTVVLTCDNPETALVTYTVTVLDDSGNPVPGVVVQICDDENCKLPMSTNEDGVVTAQYEPSEYHVILNTLPEGYYATQTEFYFGSANMLTIVINAEDVA